MDNLLLRLRASLLGAEVPARTLIPSLGPFITEDEDAGLVRNHGVPEVMTTATKKRSVRTSTKAKPAFVPSRQSHHFDWFLNAHSCANTPDGALSRNRTKFLPCKPTPWRLSSKCHVLQLSVLYHTPIIDCNLRRLFHTLQEQLLKWNLGPGAVLEGVVLMKPYRIRSIPYKISTRNITFHLVANAVLFLVLAGRNRASGTT